MDDGVLRSEKKGGSPPGDFVVPLLVRCGRFGTDEPCLHEEAVRPIEMISTPLDRGYQFDMLFFTAPAVTFYRASIGAMFRSRGALPLDRLTLSVPVRMVPGTTYWKSPPPASGLPCSVGGPIDVVFAEGQSHFNVMIHLDLLRRSLSGETFQALESAAALRLFSAAPASVERLAGWLERVLREALACPRMLQFPETLHSIEEDFIQQLANTVELQGPANLCAKRCNRTRGLYKALDYLRTREAHEVTMTGLCDVAAMSQRTLERAFRDAFDMPARDYLKVQRLHAVRRRLMAARKGEATVADIAYSHGFYELGRFAVVYSRRFGERPSETLARQFPTSRTWR